MFGGLEGVGDESVFVCRQSSDGDEPNEERDLFVAQLYKFMDDRGTPINKAPIVAGQDLNLYRLFRLVHKLGGYNRVGTPAAVVGTRTRSGESRRVVP